MLEEGCSPDTYPTEDRRLGVVGDLISSHPFDTRAALLLSSKSCDCMAKAEVHAVGDIFLDREHPENVFGLIKSELAAADLCIGNYEASFSNDGEQAKFRPWSNFLFSPPEMVTGLTSAGFDIVSLANNQSMNYGPGGLLDTMERLTTHSIGVVGAGVDMDAAGRAASKSINGLDIGILGFESTWWDWPATKAKSDRAGINQINRSPYFEFPYLNELDIERMEAQIDTAATDNDVVLAMFHFGIAGEHQHTVPQKALAHRAIESGADAVIGAHSHTLQAVEVYQSAPIFYSLGNFAFDRPKTWSLDLMPSESGMLALTVDSDGVTDATIKPAVYDHGAQSRPKFLSDGSQEYIDIVDHLQRLSERTGTTLTETVEGLRVPL